jgi:hypothetical protein
MKNLLIVVFTIFIMGMLCSCGEDQKPLPPMPLYPEGTMVKAKISGDIGQVIYTNCWPGEKACTYDIRFPFHQTKTNTHLLSDDGAISIEPLTRINKMREYELEPATVKGK